MEVLFQINGSKKELIVSKDNVVFLIELEKLKVDEVLAIFPVLKERGYHLDKNVYILQRWSDKWKDYVDVTDIEQIQDGA